MSRLFSTGKLSWKSHLWFTLVSFLDTLTNISILKSFLFFLVVQGLEKLKNLNLKAVHPGFPPAIYLCCSINCISFSTNYHGNSRENLIKNQKFILYFFFYLFRLWVIRLSQEMKWIIWEHRLLAFQLEHKLALQGTTCLKKRRRRKMKEKVSVFNP